MHRDPATQKLTTEEVIIHGVEASVAMATWGFVHGVQIVRAHDVRATVRAARVAG